MKSAASKSLSTPDLRRPTSALRFPIPPLPRVATWEEWEAGRAARRELSRRINGEKPLRRREGNPRKDRFLRALNNGERGMPFDDLRPLPAAP